MLELYLHQKIALAFLRLNDFFALFMEQGTGKTIPSLCRILDLLKSGKIKDALVVAPKSALGAWERDIEVFDSRDQVLLRSALTLINYDKVWRGGDKSPYNRKYGCIVLDEAHFIKNRASNRSKFLLKIACQADYRYILTGTPIGNGQLENIWALYCFLDPYLERGRVYSRIFGGSYQKFQDRYCILNMYHKPSSYIHVNELQDIINEHSYRVKKCECLDLPEKLPDEIIKVDLVEKALYKKLATESAILDYEILAENPLSRLVKLRQLASGYLTYRENGEEKLLELKNEKLSVLEELIEGYEADKKLVIFAEFKYSIAKISELLKRMKIKYVTLDGDQKDKTIWRQFQKDSSIRIIVCQYKTASAGIDLFASDTIIYYEPTLSSNILEQSRDRIHRTGQTQKCSYIHLLTKGTVEVEIYRALAGYSDFSEKLFTEYMEGYRRNYNA
jgi:SNF2 family DNA or RNA helicase